MTVFRNVVFIAAVAGLVAGVVLAALQAYATVPLILQAETFENAGGHGHAAGSPDPATAAHHNEEDAWAPAGGFERFAYNAGANIVSGIGLGLILIAVSELAGGISGWRQGFFWGFAGFAVFTLAPGLGLPPELPGMPAADLHDRQVWWIATVMATGIGLTLIIFRRSAIFAVAGVALIVAPHIIGAPQPHSHDSSVPGDLHHSFVVATNITNLLFWLVLGAVAGAVRSRLGGEQERMRGHLA